MSSPLERQQTKWVIFGLAVLATLGFGGEVPALIIPTLADPHSPSGSLYQLAVGTIISCLGLLIPLSFGFAMLRYRLWDIDLLIRRTLIYATLTGILTGILVLVYLGSILLLQSLFRGILPQENEVATVITTLVIYALFRPVQRPLQAIIDRRFYRRKYDAAKTLAAFSATLRNEVDLSQLSERLVAVVQQTMQPTHVSLWLRPTAPDRKQSVIWSSRPPASEHGEQA